MKILAIELSTARGSLAWRDNDVDPSTALRTSLAPEWPNDRKNSGAFFENLDNITKKCGAAELIVVGLGPGSYAGTRIAISAAIGLQISSGARLIGFPSICAMESAEAVVRGADVVVAVTASPTPVIQSDWVADGAHVIAVGSCLPTQRELDPALVARSRVIVDSRDAALKEAGDVVMGIAEGRWTAAHIEAELGELPTRHNDHEITVFKSLGLAVEDIFAAHLVLTHSDTQ